MIDARPIEFTYSEEKALSTVRLLLRLEDRAMDVIRLVKLLYLSERESLAEGNRPIFGDFYKALPHGPVVQRTYDHLKKPWNGLRRHGHSVLLGDGQESSALTRNQEKLITRVSEKFLGVDDWQLVDFCHKLPEYRDPHGSATPISVREILSALGKSQEEIEEVEKAAERARFVHESVKSYHVLPLE